MASAQQTGPRNQGVVTVHSRIFSLAASLSLLALAAGCTTGGSGTGGLFGKGAGGQAKVAETEPSGTTYVRGTCPEVELRDGTAYYRTYAGGGAKDEDPSKVVTQASLTETTRKCTVSGNQLTMEVAAAGRVVAGPAGGPGTVTMPIRVAVLDKEGNTIYSQLTHYKAELPSGTATTQFLFTKPDVTIPLDQATTARVFVGFDEGPYNTP